MRCRGAAFVFRFAAGKRCLSCRGVKFAGGNRPPLMDDLKIKRFLRRNCDLRLLGRSYILEPIVIWFQLKCVRAIWEAKCQRRIAVTMPTPALSIHTTIFNSSTWPTALPARSFGQKTVTCPVGLSTTQGACFYSRRKRNRSARGFAGLGGRSAIRTKAQKKADGDKKPIGKALPTRTSCFSIPKSSSVELAEQRSDRFRNQF